MQKLLLIVALSVALVGSTIAARPAQSASLCSLPEKWDQADFAAQAFASMNGACPSAAGKQTEDDDTCVPCVCGAYQLFSDALDHPMIRSDSRSKMSSPMSVSLFGEVFNSCIEENAKKFIKPLQIQMGLNDCLSSTDAPIKNGAQLAALCASWVAQSEVADNEVQNIQSNEADHTISLLPADTIPEIHVVEDRVRSMLQESRVMQEVETSAEGSAELSEESSGEYFFPPPGASYPPVYPPGVYPPGVYPPTPSRDTNFSPPPPSPTTAAGVTVAGMMPLLMALVSAFLMATMMI